MIEVDVDISSVQKSYGVVLSAPPWSSSSRKSASSIFSSYLTYDAMSMDEIESVHRQVLQVLDDKANIFLWATDKSLMDAEDLIRRLGLQLHVRMVWDKCNGPSPAYTIRFTHEFLLWCYKKGHMLPVRKQMSGYYGSVFREPVGDVYRKPLCVYSMLEMLFPDANKLDLFAVFHREGWDQWGSLSSVLDGL